MALVRSTAKFESNIVSVERVKEYTKIQQESEWINEKKRPAKNWPQHGSIKFINYSVKYRDDLDYSLKNLNLTIKPAEKIAIVGKSGAGKSTFSLALFRILESNIGDIQIDDVSIKSIGIHDLRRILTIIPQDPILFSGSIRMNLDPLEIYSDSQLWAVLEQCNLKSFVESLNGQLMHECSDGGDNLSIGQHQLICLARAVLKNTKIIILDEATAAIDYKTEKSILNIIRNLFSNATVITIAHRLDLVKDCDRIMLIDQGSLIEFDTVANLMKNKNGRFLFNGCFCWF
jgi:ABC-type multidrug transport system fused ATPase/permease subunit